MEGERVGADAGGRVSMCGLQWPERKPGQWNEEQTEQFTLDAPSCRHDSREKGLGPVGSAGASIVLPVQVHLSQRFVV